MTEIELPTPLMEACRQLQELRMEMAADADVRRARRRVIDQTHLLQDAQNEVERREQPYQAKIKEVEGYITSHALEVGQSFESGGIKVQYTKGYSTISIPKNELDVIQNDDPELWKRLEPYVKTSERDARVTIK